jgi:hypothetical protein
MNANVSDRNSLMTIYPLECFVIDAAQNSMARETTRHGLLIETAPDHDGSFHGHRTYPEAVVASSVVAISGAGPPGGTEAIAPSKE